MARAGKLTPEAENIECPVFFRKSWPRIHGNLASMLMLSMFYLSPTSFASDEKAWLKGPEFKKQKPNNRIQHITPSSVEFPQK